MSTKVQLGSKTKVVVKWKVLSSMYDEETAKNIAAKFAIKYGIPVANVKVEPERYSLNKDGEEIPFTNATAENVQSPEHQRELMRSYIKENGITDVDIDKIFEIDDMINHGIDYTVYENHRNYTLKWMKWSNFMSYGDTNYFDFTTLHGLVLLTSEPANQGGKSTFCYDLFRFLLYGKITDRENDWTLAKAFNRFKPEATEAYVEGCICIDGQDYVINRTLSRPALNRRTAKSKVTQKVSYYKIVDGNYINLEDNESMDGSTNMETTKVIKEAIGNEQDFDLMICINQKNLEDLISLKDADRGRLLSRWIGLLPLEEKDKLARDTFNKSITPKLLLNRYNKEELNSVSEQLANDIKANKEKIKQLEKEKKASIKKIEQFNQTRDELLQSKSQIDENLTRADKTTLETTQKRLAEGGKLKVAEMKRNQEACDALGTIDFDENLYNTKIAEDKKTAVSLSNARIQCAQYKKDIEALKKGEFCPTCGARLANVDNTAAIKAKEDAYNELVETGKALKLKAESLEKEIGEMNTKRTQYNEKNRLELLIAKNAVDVENLRSQYKEVTQTLKDIKANADAIEANNKIEIAITNINANIKTEESYRDNTQRTIDGINNTNAVNQATIEENNEIVKTITDEEKLVRNWKVYLEMIGRNGISKMVLRSLLPYINSELKRLLYDVCDFDVAVEIDDNNDVGFFMIHDDVKAGLGGGSGLEKTVASLALRSVLGHISTFSKPSFVVLDEVLGAVADENYDAIKRLYDKMATEYSYMLQITHLKAISDWHDTNIVVKKENNISRVETAM